MKSKQTDIHIRSGKIVIGVDTHKYLHVAAVIDSTAGVLATLTIPVDSSGYAQLLNWAQSFGTIITAGIEGTGSYGSGLTSYLRRNNIIVVEVNRPDRRMRRLVGKSDTIDAINAAHAALSGTATAIPKTADGSVEMIRQLKIVHDTGVKARTATMITLKAMIVHAPEQLKYDLHGKTQLKLARTCASFPSERLATPTDSLMISLAVLGRRWLALDEEILEISAKIAELVQQTNPLLTQNFGIGADTAAEILIVAGDNPKRITSEAAFAKLAGISPIPASSGLTSGKQRINYGGHRQLNAAIYRVAIVRMQFHEPTKKYVTRRLTEGKSKRDIIRCLKRFIIRGIYRQLISWHKYRISPTDTFTTPDRTGKHQIEHKKTS